MNSVLEAAMDGRPAAELLLGLTAAPRRFDSKRISTLLAEIDWDEFLGTAQSHGLLPRAYDRLAEIGRHNMPAAVRDSLAVAAQLNAARNLGMAGELMGIIRNCRESDIALVPIKGVVLAQQLTGSVTQRVSNDIDLLVRPKDVLKLQSLLTERGYFPTWQLDEGYQDVLLSTQRQLPFSHEKYPWLVEIHTSLMDGPDATATTYAALAPQLVTTSFNGESVEVLRNEELLLYLCAHGAKHCWDRLSWIDDVARLLGEPQQLDWSTLRLRAAVRGWETALLLGLTLARDLLGAAVPASFPDKGHLRVEALARRVARQMFESRSIKHSVFWRFAFQLRVRDRLRDRVSVAWSTLLRPNVADWQSLSVPAKFSPLHFVWRPVRLAAKYARRAIGR